MKEKQNGSLAGRLAKGLHANTSQYMLLIETLVIFFAFSILTDGMFINARNLNNLMMQGVVYSLMGIGLVFVIVSGDMDLSGGSVLGALVATAAVLQVEHGMPTIPTMIITIAAGVLIGVWHGFWIAYRNVPSFIVTLASFLAFRGVTLLIGHGQTVGPANDSFAMLGSKYLPSIFFEKDLSILITIAVVIIMTILPLRKRSRQQKFGLSVQPMKKLLARIVVVDIAVVVACGVLISYRGFPYALLVLAAFMAVFTYAANGTTFGRYTYSVGGNREATKMSGINVKRQTMLIYMLSGFCYAVAAIIYLGRVGSSTANTGTNFEFSAITGCVVGGVSTMGGKGTVMGAILGTMLMAGLDNGMSLLNIDATYQYIVRGLVLLFAVAVDIASQKKKS